MTQILEFLEIKDLEAFNWNDLHEAIKKCTVLGNKMVDAEDIILIFDKLKDIIFINGGKDFLFPNGKDSISREEFISLLKPKCTYSEETLKELFNYLVKTERNFTKDDYKNQFIDKRRIWHYVRNVS
mgnify:CR=1 FL=1